MAALRGESSDRRCIWIMRQAGRYLPEYMAVRERVSFRDLCRTPELVCEVTLQPIQRFGLDAAILFSDILTPLEPMGAQFDFTDGGPRLARPLRSEADIAALQVIDPRQELAFVAEGIRLIKAALPTTPLLGFGGAPFTLAAYLIEGGGSQNYQQLKTLLFSRPELAETLLSKLADQVADHLLMQIEAGVDAVQIFDSWAGILSVADHERFALPYLQTIIDRLAPTRVPRILFTRGGLPYLDRLQATGAEVLALDWTMDLATVAARFPGQALQGNLDPLALFGSEAEIRRRAEAICRAGDTAAGHVFNLGHGILPETPIAAVETLVQTVQSYRPESA